MSLELELWAMNSARISALEAGGGGGGSTSDLCIRVPKFDWSYAYDHIDEMIAVEMEEENDYGWYVDFTVQDDGKPHYAALTTNVGMIGVQASMIIMESCGGQLLDGDVLSLNEMADDEQGGTVYLPVYSNSLVSCHQTILYDPEREDTETKTYSIAYNGDSYINPVLLKNGASYRLWYEKIITPDTGDEEHDASLEEMRELIATASMVMILPGTYEEIPVVVRNGGNT